MGRPTKLTPEVQERIVTALRAGNYQETAAAYAGIAAPTFYRWMERGADSDDDPIYSEFREAVERARAEAETRNIALIQKAANDGTWQAAAWFLERTAPQRWGRWNRVEVTGRDGGPIEVHHDARESLAAKFAEIERRAVGHIIDAEVVEDDDEEAEPPLRLAQ